MKFKVILGVDFGIWRTLDPRFLSCPLDIHSGNVARSIGILKRSQNDFQALKELDKKEEDGTLNLLPKKEAAFLNFGHGSLNKNCKGIIKEILPNMYLLTNTTKLRLNAFQVGN